MVTHACIFTHRLISEMNKYFLSSIVLIILCFCAVSLQAGELSAKADSQIENLHAEELRVKDMYKNGLASGQECREAEARVLRAVLAAYRKENPLDEAAQRGRRDAVVALAGNLQCQVQMHEQSSRSAYLKKYIELLHFQKEESEILSLDADELQGKLQEASHELKALLEKQYEQGLISFDELEKQRRILSAHK